MPEEKDDPKFEVDVKFAQSSIHEDIEKANKYMRENMLSTFESSVNTTSDGKIIITRDVCKTFELSTDKFAVLKEVSKSFYITMAKIKERCFTSERLMRDCECQAEKDVKVEKLIFYMDKEGLVIQNDNIINITEIGRYVLENVGCRKGTGQYTID